MRPTARFPCSSAESDHADRDQSSEDGLGLNHLGRAKQVWPEPGHPYQQRSVTAAQSNTRRCSPYGDVELMAQKHILGLKPPPRLEQTADEHTERVQDRKH